MELYFDIKTIFLKIWLKPIKYINTKRCIEVFLKNNFLAETVHCFFKIENTNTNCNHQYLTRQAKNIYCVE